MDLEARSLPAGVKTQLLNKLQDYKARLVPRARASNAISSHPVAAPQSNLASLKAVVKKAGAALMDAEGARDELLSRAELGDTAGGASSGAQRDRLLSAQDKLKQTGDRIKEGKKTLLETEELGVSILQDLHKQRETIAHTRDTLHGADENIGQSRRILTAMGRRAMQNKIMLGVISVILIFAIISACRTARRAPGPNATRGKQSSPLLARRARMDGDATRTSRF